MKLIVTDLDGTLLSDEKRVSKYNIEILNRAVKEKDIELSDMAIGLKFIAENSKDIPTTLKGTKHYEYLKSIGFTGDMEHCFTMDKYDILPFYNDGKIIVKE